MEGETSLPPEIASERWDYSNKFAEYLIRVALEGREALESTNNFPTRIELNTQWHSALDKMREETKDGMERWTPIGIQNDMNSIVIPTDFFKGEEKTIPFASILEKDEIRMLIKLGITNLAGDIHSHPEHFQSFVQRFLFSGRLITEYRGFSPMDLKGVIQLSITPTNLHVFGVVDQLSNYFTFIAKDTDAISHDSPLQTDKEFSYYWFKKYAPSVVEKLPPVFTTLWDINIAIAKQYNLVLYRGKPGEDLVKYCPRPKSK